MSVKLKGQKSRQSELLKNDKSGPELYSKQPSLKQYDRLYVSPNL